MGQSRFLVFGENGQPLDDWEEPPFIEGQHHWIIWRELESCLWCGHVRPRDPARERACKGKTKVTLR